MGPQGSRYAAQYRKSLDCTWRRSVACPPAPRPVSPQNASAALLQAGTGSEGWNSRPKTTSSFKAGHQMPAQFPVMAANNSKNRATTEVVKRKPSLIPYAAALFRYAGDHPSGQMPWFVQITQDCAPSSDSLLFLSKTFEHVVVSPYRLRPGPYASSRALTSRTATTTAPPSKPLSELANIFS